MYALCGKSVSRPDRWCYMTGLEKTLNGRLIVGRDTARAMSFLTVKDAEDYQKELAALAESGKTYSHSMDKERIMGFEVVTIAEAKKRCTSSRPFRIKYK